MLVKRKLAQVPHLHVEARVQPASFNAEKRTVDVCFTTGAAGKRFDWRSWTYYTEELQVDTASVRLGRLEKGAPVLDSHNSYGLRNTIGVVERAWIEDGKGYATLRLSERPEVAGIVADIQSGIIRNISVGYLVHRYQDVTLPDAKEKTLRAIDWEPVEVSFVAVPFDAGAQVRSAERDTAKMPPLFEVEIIENARAASQTHRERATMDEDLKRELAEKQAREAAETKAREDAEKLAREAADKATAAERTRQAEIRDVAKALSLRDLGEEHCNKTTSADEFRKLAITAKAKADEATDTRSQGTSVTITRDEKQTRAEGMAEVLLNRHDPRANELTEKGKAFRGMSLIRMAEEIVGGRGLTPNEIAQRALSTSDFPILCEAAVARSLRGAYKVAPRTFVDFVRFGTLKDYRETKRVQFGDAPTLLPVVEGAEYTEGTIGEGAETIRLAKYGRLVAITEETIINDDLDAFTRVPGMMGSAAARLESKLVYTDTLVGNPDMADTVALFHADHGNLGSALGVTEAALTAMRAAMRAQMTLDGEDYLDLAPAFLIVGPAKETEAQKILTAVVASASSGVNPFSGSMKLIVENRVTGNKWFTAASPSQIDTIEVAYLDGMSGPQVTRDESFKSDGLTYKVKHVVGVKAIDHRGLYYNPGA